MGNVLFAGLLFVFGLIYYRASTQIPRNMMEDPVGASGFPRALAIVIVLLACALIVQEFLAWRRRTVVLAEGGSGTSRMRELKPTLLLLATMIVFLCLFDFIGYVPAITLLLLAVSYQSGIPLGWKPATIALVGAVAFQLMFGAVLGVRLPLGPLELVLPT